MYVIGTRLCPKVEIGITTPWFWISIDTPDWSVDPPYRPRLVPRIERFDSVAAEFRRYAVLVWVVLITVGWGRQVKHEEDS